MAGEEKAGAGADVASNSAGIMGKTIKIGIGLIVILIIITAVFFVKHASGAGVPAPEKAVLYDMGEFTTNLSDNSDLKYIKVKVVLKLGNAVLANEIKDKEPILRDSLVSLFNRETGEDVMNGRTRLKTDTMAVLNSHLVSGKITDIYFSDLVMQ